MKNIWRKSVAFLTAALLSLTAFVCGGVVPMTSSAETLAEAETADEVSSLETAGEPGDIIIGDVEVELDQLIKDHYKVTVPVTMPNNPGFTLLQFGVKWDLSQFSVQGARCTGDFRLPVLTFSGDNRQIWMTFLDEDCKETDIVSLTALLPTTAKVGDTFVLEGAYKDYASSEAMYCGADMVNQEVTIYSGTITIVDDVESQVGLEIGSVKPSMRDLDENDYVVEVPVTATTNTGFGDLVFGFRWDTDKMTAEPPSGDTPEGLSLIPEIDNDTGIGWIHVIADGSYTGEAICTLRFQVPDNSKPGDIYPVTACTSDGDQEAKVSSRSGKAGTITMTSGQIFVSSTQAASTFAFGKVMLPEISLSMEDLAQSDHLISVPITITANSSFTLLAFGVQWNTNDLSVVSCTCDDTKNLGLMETYSDDNNAVWLQFLYRGPYDAYSGTALCTLTFRVRSDISLGDKIELTPTTSNEDGESLMIVSTKGTYGSLNMQPGVINLVSQDELTAVATVKIGDVQITPHDLWVKSNLVDIPITLNKNSGISSLSFGLSWGDRGLIPKELNSTDIDTVGVDKDFTSSSEMVWLSFSAVNPKDGYVYRGKKLATLRVRLPEGLQAGDVIDLSSVSISSDGTAAVVEAADNSLSSPALLSGSITIIPDEEETTTTPGTTTTTETETTVMTTETTVSSSETETTTTEATTTTEMTTTTETVTETTTETETETEATTAATTATVTTAAKANRLNRTELQIRAGQSSWLRFYPVDGTGEDCAWLSSDPGVVQVSAGARPAEVTLTGAASGTAEVTVLYQGQLYTCRVTVLPAEEATSCDVNHDEKTDLADLVVLNKMLVGQIPMSEAEQQEADLNGDGYLDNKDALLLMQMLVEQGLLTE